MRKIKKELYKHFNCIPWLIVGIEILVDGEISRFQYAMCWICTLILVWHYASYKPKRKESGDDNAGMINEGK